MRNKKGFTLVELIVVIAIIGILAAILVPSMLGFVRDARISSANSNAHAVYTGVQAWLTKYATQYPTSGLHEIDVDENTITTPSFSASGWSPKTGYDISLAEYIGETFKGYAICKMDGSGSAVSYALWQADAKPTSDAQRNAAGQTSDAKSGLIVGCHPLAK